MTVQLVDIDDRFKRAEKRDNGKWLDIKFNLTGILENAMAARADAGDIQGALAFYDRLEPVAQNRGYKIADALVKKFPAFKFRPAEEFDFEKFDQKAVFVR